MFVQNMKSPTTGRDVPNQFVIEHAGREYFQSYSSIIACIGFSGKVELDETYWNYSKTTSKYRAIFLGESTKETQSKIDSGEYILTNLN